MRRYITFYGIVVIMLFWATTGFAVTLYVNGDTDINFNQVTENYGTKRYLVVSPTREAFVSFDLSALPADMEINHAALKLWVGKLNNPGLIDLHVVESPWDESTLTAAAAPMIDSSPFETLTILEGDLKKYVTVEVTTVV